MKLSKDELALVLAEAELEIYDAFIGGTLEIEGYVREEDHIADDSKKVEEWVKFDPDNPKTHPGEHARVLLSIDGTITCGTRQFKV